MQKRDKGLRSWIENLEWKTMGKIHGEGCKERENVKVRQGQEKVDAGIKDRH